MKHATQVALVERVLAHAAARTTDMDPEVFRQPAERYTDPQRYARELSLLRRLPQVVGHISQLADPGDFITREVAGIPVLVARDAEGRLGAFLNVCRHRGTRLVEAATGCARRGFVCPYHAWSYGCDGALRGIPHAKGFPGIERSERGLVRLPVAEAAGFVFTVATPGAALNADQLLGPLAEDLVGFGLPEHVVHDPRVERRALNWKLSLDVFLEPYHLRTTHAESIYPMFFDTLGLVDPFPPHLRNVFPKRSIRGLAESDPAGWRLREHANVLYLLFPNTLILVEPDHAAVLHLQPEGPARTRLESYALVPEPPDEKARRYWAKNNAILYAATDEDFQMGESIQAALAAGANESFCFGRFEHALAHFHRAVDAALVGMSSPLETGS